MSSIRSDLHRALASIPLAVLLALLSAAPASAEALTESDESSAWDVPIAVADVVFVRPLGLTKLVFGTTFFAVGGPIGAIYGQYGELFQLYVMDAVDFTFRRSLGAFEDQDL